MQETTLGGEHELAPAGWESVRHQRDALLRLQHQREELTSFLMHDMKSPANAIDLHAQFVERDPATPDAARDSLAQIRSEVRVLLRMIVDVLDVSRAAEQELRPRLTTVDLGALCWSVFESFHLKAVSRGVALDARLVVTVVRADADLLRRTLENLVDNALQVAPVGSRVILSSTSDGGAVLLRVRDFGRGVPVELRERVFDRYVQAEPHAPSSRGLGLAFCKLAIEAHRGRIWVEDGSPGAAFCVRIPYGP